MEKGHFRKKCFIEIPKRGIGGQKKRALGVPKRAQVWGGGGVHTPSTPPGSATVPPTTMQRSLLVSHRPFVLCLALPWRARGER